MPGETAQEAGHVIRASMVTFEQMTAAALPTALAFTTLVREMPKDGAARRVPGLDWSAAEVAAHMVTVVRRGAADARRAGSLQELAELNATCVAELEERDPDRLADLFQAALAESRVSPDGVIALHMGLVTDHATAMSYFLGDMLVHGVDIARATGQDWTVDPARAALVVRAVLPAFEPWVRREIVDGPRQRVVFGLSDGGVPAMVEVGEGRYRAGPAGNDGARDDHTDADGAAVLLAMTGRESPTDAVLARFCSWCLPI